MRSVFIAGTDTGVGKTTVAATLLAAARRAGVDAVPMKPVQTGCARRGRMLIAPDLRLCLAAAGMRLRGGEQDALCPYRFRPACSPHLAARLARTPIRMHRLRACLDALRQSHDAVIVEGAGGVLVPIGPGRTMADAMRAFGLPVVLVARAGLGTLNHTLLTLEALRARGLTVAGVVLVHAAADRGDRRIVADNRRTLTRAGKVLVLTEFPFRPAAQASPTALARAFARPARRLLAALT